MEHIYCPEDDTYRIYCDICDKLCIDRYYQNHLQSQTHLNNLRRINSTNYVDFLYLFETLFTI